MYGEEGLGRKRRARWQTRVFRNQIEKEVPFGVGKRELQCSGWRRVGGWYVPHVGVSGETWLRRESDVGLTPTSSTTVMSPAVNCIKDHIFRARRMIP